MKVKFGDLSPRIARAPRLCIFMLPESDSRIEGRGHRKLLSKRSSQRGKQIDCKARNANIISTAEIAENYKSSPLARLKRI
jgi:hypothetical protein